MLVSVTFAYRMEHVPPRARKPRWSAVVDDMPVKIVEFAAGEAEPAFVVRPGSGAPDRTLYGADGQLYAPVVDYGPAARSEIEDAVWRLRNGVAPAPSAARIESFGRTEIRASDRGERMARIAREAATLCLIGGTLCRRAAEPVWHVAKGGHSVMVLLREHPMPPERVFPGSAIYRADRFEDAAAHARMLEGDDPKAIVVDGGVEVLRPECVRFDDESHALVEAAKEAVSTWRCPDLEAEMAEFDRAVAEGRGTEATARALDGLVGWLDQAGFGAHAGMLRACVWRRERLPGTAERRAADMDAALEALR